MSTLTKLLIKPQTVAAAVLAGGKSSRLGKDKSMLRLEGKTLTARMALKLLKAGYAPVFVVGPKKNFGLSRGVDIIGERFRGKGPLSGIESALRHAQASCLVIACDLPYISISALKRLHLAANKQGVAFQENPLPAVFPLKFLPEIQRCLDKGKLAVFPLLKNARRIKAPSGRQLFNLNDKNDLKIVRSDKSVA